LREARRHRVRAVDAADFEGQRRLDAPGVIDHQQQPARADDHAQHL
jgi:hypothetical protein